MPYKDRAKQREYQKLWIRKRRQEWLTANPTCAKCGSDDRIELDHIDPSSKISHKIWSWSEKRRKAEIAKCQPLCYSCHKKKTYEQNYAKKSNG